MKIILLVFSFIWQLPQNIVALILLLIWRKRSQISSYKGCYAYTVYNFSAGVSLGNFCFVGRFYEEAPDALYPYVLHEMKGHGYQSRLLGPLYLIVIGIPSFIHAKLCKDDDLYYNFYTERWANKIAGIYYDTKYHLLVYEDEVVKKA